MSNNLLKTVLIWLFCAGTALSQQHSFRQLTFSDSTHDGYPYWSPDGQTIIYSSGTRSSCYTKKIPSSGGKSALLTPGFAQHARYSPDGAYVVFDGEAGRLIQLASSTGGIPIRIIPQSVAIVQSGFPCFSADGEKIAFRSNNEINILELQTGTIGSFCKIEGKTIIPYDWMPDGKHILADARDTLNRKEVDLWIISVENGVARRLTFLPGYQAKPSVSPDGLMIVFSSNHGGNHDLWMTTPGGGEPVQLTFFAGDSSNPGFDVEPSWSPAGDEIAFSSTRSGYWAIWIMKPDLAYLKERLDLE